LIHVFGSARVRIGVSRSTHFHNADDFLYLKRLFVAIADCLVLLSSLDQFRRREVARILQCKKRKFSPRIEIANFLH
jgi:hypothetical protein